MAETDLHIDDEENDTDLSSSPIAADELEDVDVKEDTFDSPVGDVDTEEIDDEIDEIEKEDKEDA